MATTKRNVYNIGFKDETYATLLHRLGGRQSIHLVSDVTLSQHGHSISYRYHETDVVTFEPDGTVSLYTGGWWTPSTKNCINAILNGIAQVVQKNNDWSLYFNGRRYAFEGGMSFNINTKVVSTNELPLPVKLRKTA